MLGLIIGLRAFRTRQVVPIYKSLACSILLIAPSLVATIYGQSQAARSSAGQMTASRRVAIVGGTLMDGRGGAPVPDSVVLVEGDHIAAIGPRRSVKIPKAARVIDARGQVIAPGFIDMHNHSGGGLNTEFSLTALRSGAADGQQVTNRV